MLGSEFFLELQQAYDKAYSGYLDSAKANRLIRRSLIRMVEKIYRDSDTQKESDELFSMVVLDETHSVSTDRFAADNLNFKYMHLLRMAFTFSDSIPSFTYGNGYYTCTGHNLREGDVLTLSGATTGNGVYTISKVRKDKFWLPLVYVDGTLTLTRTFEASPKRSDRKKSKLHAANKFSPRYSQTHDDNYAVPNAWILDPAPSSVIVDYVMFPDLEIDVDNAVVDLSNYYSDKFLYRLIDECVLTFSEEVRDYQGRQVANQAIIDNP